MAVDQGGATTYVIWLVRVILPIVLFFFWYRSQSKGHGDDGPSYHRDELIELRKAPKGDSPPPSISNLKLLEEAELQKLGFAGASRGGGSGRREGGGGNKGGKRGEKGGGKGGNDGKGGGVAAAVKRDNSNGSQFSFVLPPQAKPLLTEQERMHVESLLNYVAFSHKERPQRVFLPDTEWPPPPPPPRKPSLGGIASDEALPEADPAGASKANLEAQMVLKGVVNPKIGLKCSKIAQALFKQLQESNVPTSEGTFALLVEACVCARDLKTASEFLMKMEGSGFCPNSELLDKVMDLYSEHRTSDPVPKASSSEAPWRNDEAVPFDNQENDDNLTRRLFGASASSAAASSSTVGGGGGGCGGGGGDCGCGGDCGSLSAASPSMSLRPGGGSSSLGKTAGLGGRKA